MNYKRSQFKAIRKHRLNEIDWMFNEKKKHISKDMAQNPANKHLNRRQIKAYFRMNFQLNGVNFRFQ